MNDGETSDRLGRPTWAPGSPGASADPSADRIADRIADPSHDPSHDPSAAPGPADPVRGGRGTDGGAPRRGWTWALAGVAAGLAGLGTSYVAASALAIRTSPVVAVGDLVIRHTPGQVAEDLIQRLGHHDKPLLITGILVVLLVLFAVAGRLARRGWAAPAVLLTALAVVGGVAVALEHGADLGDQVPVAVGFVTWLLALQLLTDPLRQGELVVADHPDLAAHTRRTFLIRAGLVAGAAAVTGGLGRVVGRGRRAVEAARDRLDLSQVTQPVVPKGADLGLDGLTPWLTPASAFYTVHTALVPPAIEPAGWSLRIHGAVDREITLTYDDLLARKFIESWVTLDCVSNPVGGNLISNGWWSGVRLADILAEAGPQTGADAVLQTSQDGWTCGTPLSALTDDRGAMLAVALNGEPLPIDHGFPVRTVVPGLYGYVSACKWVVDMEVSSFDKITAFWTERGWGVKGPVKTGSRVDVPAQGAEVAAGAVRLAGVAWLQHTGIKGVQWSLDGGPWTDAELARDPSVDSWVQWTGTAQVAAGDHRVRVRAIDEDGTVQTGVERDVLPDGATGWASSDFRAS